MAPPSLMEEEEKGHAKAPKNASLVEEESIVRRPGRLRVLHPDVAEFLRSPCVRHPRRPTPPSSPRAAAGAEEEEEDKEEFARYDCAFEAEEEGFAPPRLVWGKVKKHPWWPGQVFDPADASELARRQQRRRGALLVAYFWDKSFSWTDAAALRPLRARAAGFRRFAAQGALSPFVAAVDAALAEVARRVDVGLSCGCGGNMAVAKRQVVDNAGVRDGAYGAAVDVAFTRRAFQGEAFMAYVSALATNPIAGADGVDLTVATAQLKAFSRWRGSRGLPEYAYFDGIDGVAKKSASARTRKRRSRSGDASARRKIARCSAGGNADDDDDALELDDLEVSPEPKSPELTKIGILMNRAAQQMSRSPVVLRRADINATPKVVPYMAKCSSVVVNELPAMSNGGPALKDDHTCRVPPVAEQTGLVLNFSSSEAVPSASDLTTIFSQFGPIMEVSGKNAGALVTFKRRAHAEAAFARTAKIRAISSSLISFRLTHSLPSATVDPPVREERGEGTPCTLPVP